MSKKKPTVLHDFHPAVVNWFQKTFDHPSPAQQKAWPAIHKGDNTLLLAPTGSGKTLAAFLCAIDRLCRQPEPADGIQILYISPLKALGNDIHKNLLVPLEGIKKAARKKLPDIRVAVRSGDTPQSERAKMIRKPPHILITTPESLYLLLGSKRMADALKTIRTVIVDEIHAMCDNKRGVHLAVSLERLQHRTGHPIQRIGCSATIHPLTEIAAFLVGYTAPGKQRPCRIIDAGMRKQLDVKVMAPLPDFLSAGNNAMWASAYELLLDEIRKHETTLIFCNSRYKAERTALNLNELAGDDVRIGVHHGSMSREHRLEMEDKLKAGQLDALVATSSLELGIDVGSVDLVYQLESSKSVAAGTQRIGRAGHLLNMTSKGRFLIFERDELFEGAVICKLITEGKIDAIQIPRNCLDVLAQQIAGAVSSRDWDENELLNLLHGCFPFHNLSQQQYNQVLDMLAATHPFEMTHPPKALILRDPLSGVLTAARGAKQVCSMCVGTIPDNADYEVVIEKTKKRVGKVYSEFVDDSLRTGDIFVLGSSAWKVCGKIKNKLLVKEAPGATPTVPWWTGPIEPRTPEVGSAVGQLKRQLAERLNEPGLLQSLCAEYKLGPDAAAAMIDYVREQKTAVEMVPDRTHFLVETWIDELGQTNIIIHCPLGRRLNKTWGLGIAEYARKARNRKWNVTATNDLVLLTYSKDKKNWRTPGRAEKLLKEPGAKVITALKGMQDTLFATGSAFRETAACALQIRRAKRGRRVPMWLQSHRAQELYEVSHTHAEYPVNQEIHRAYYEEALDIQALEELLEDIKQKRIELVFKTVESPSPFSHSLLIQDVYRSSHQMGRDRRAHLLRLHRRVLHDILSSEQLARLLDTRAIAQLEKRLLFQSESTRAKNAAELLHALRELGDVPADIDAIQAITEGRAAKLLAPLLKDHRIVAVPFPDDDAHPFHLVPADLWRSYHDAFTGKKRRTLNVHLPKLQGNQFIDFTPISSKTIIDSKWLKKSACEQARTRIIERYLKRHGPVTLYDLMNYFGWPAGAIEKILAELTGNGTIVEGVYDGEKPRPQWISKINLEEIHRLTMRYLKRELAACAPYEVVDFMTRWQHRHPAHRLQGIDGLRKIIRQLQGIEQVQAAWESEILPCRMTDYSPDLLDQLIASGEVCWRRLDGSDLKRGRIALCMRRDMEWLTAGRELSLYTSHNLEWTDLDIKDDVEKVRNYFKERTSVFYDDILNDTGLNEDHVLRAVWQMVWCGEIVCDTFECIRHAGLQTTLSDCYDLANTSKKILDGRIPAELVIKHIKSRNLNPRLGRWTATERLIPGKKAIPRQKVTAHWAQLLLERWGIVSRDIIDSEICSPAWQELVPEFKRLELLGKLSRGYFIESHQGEQYGLHEAVELMRDCRARRADGKELGWLPDEPVFGISSRDPANLYSYSLEILDEQGHSFKRTQKRGNLLHVMIIQAGQVILSGRTWRTSQLTTLNAAQLAACIERLKCDIIGNKQRLQIGYWNEHPIEMSPASHILWKAGFRFNSRRELCWPPPGKENRKLQPVQIRQKLYHPFYCDPVPADYNKEWIISRAEKTVQEPLQKLLNMLEKTLRAPFELHFHQEGFSITYKGERCINPHIQKTKINLHITNKGWIAPLPVTPQTDVNAKEFMTEFKNQVNRCMQTIDTKLNK